MNKETAINWEREADRALLNKLRIERNMIENRLAQPSYPLRANEMTVTISVEQYKKLIDLSIPTLLNTIKTNLNECSSFTESQTEV